MLTFSALFAGLASFAAATIYTTTPIAGTVCTGGQQCVIRWMDDGQPPLSTSWGPTLVDIWAGTDTAQTFVATLGTIANPAVTTSLAATIPPGAAPNGQYFIRFTSINGRDAAGVPYLSFSTRFQLVGMTGNALPTATQDPVMLTAAPMIGKAPVTSIGPVSSAIANAPVPVTVTSMSRSNAPIVAVASQSASMSTVSKSSAGHALVKASPAFVVLMVAAVQITLGVQATQM